MATDGKGREGEGRAAAALAPSASTSGPRWIPIRLPLDLVVKETAEPGLKLSCSSLVQDEGNMTLQCTKPAGHWKVGRGMGVSGKWRVQVQENPHPHLH